MTAENLGLSTQVREGQEKLRLSAGQTASLVAEIEGFKQRIVVFNQEN